MSDELQLTLKCPKCYRMVMQRAIVVQRERRMRCPDCGLVAATDMMLAQISAALVESDMKFDELNAASRFNLR